MSESHSQILWAKHQSIDIVRIGHLCTSLSDQFIHPSMGKLSYEMIKYVVAQAMLQGVGGGQTEAALTVREIHPYIDLLDGNDNPIEHNQWIQPANLKNTYNSLKDSGELKRHSYYGSSIPKEPMMDYTVYNTGKKSRNDQKVMIIYGLEFLNDFVNRNVEYIDFWRRGTKLISIVDIARHTRSPIYKAAPLPIENISIGESPWYKDYESFDYRHDPKRIDDSDNIKEEIKTGLMPYSRNTMYHNNLLIFATPILFKKDDMAQIRFRFSDVTKPSDEIKLKGYVAEAIGINTMG